MSMFSSDLLKMQTFHHFLLHVDVNTRMSVFKLFLDITGQILEGEDLEWKAVGDYFPVGILFTSTGIVYVDPR